MRAPDLKKTDGRTERPHGEDRIGQRGYFLSIRLAKGTVADAARAGVECGQVDCPPAHLIAPLGRVEMGHVRVRSVRDCGAPIGMLDIFQDEGKREGSADLGGNGEGAGLRVRSEPYRGGALGGGCRLLALIWADGIAATLQWCRRFSQPEFPTTRWRPIPPTPATAAMVATVTRSGPEHIPIGQSAQRTSVKSVLNGQATATPDRHKHNPPRTPPPANANITKSSLARHGVRFP